MKPLSELEHVNEAKELANIIIRELENLKYNRYRGLESILDSLKISNNFPKFKRKNNKYYFE
ncbi:hypothetical protein [Methanocaldococcus infernus]|uniref:hypothetical protein n=1 Tax=Methanocaldococcus infernus TaxID=67760 RepID=UPI0001A81839|nr:hypothetical protein [Methanocaldococcus infernus]